MKMKELFNHLLTAAVALVASGAAIADDPVYVAGAEYEVSNGWLIVKSGDDTFKDCKTASEIEEKLKSLQNIKVGVQNGTTGQFYVQGNKEWDFPGLKVDGKGYKNGSLAVQDLVNGNIKYVIIDKEPANAITAKINAQ